MALRFCLDRAPKDPTIRSPNPKNVLATWYWGSEVGYDAKNDGVYFTVEFEHDGAITAPSLTIYNTQ